MATVQTKQEFRDRMVEARNADLRDTLASWGAAVAILSPWMVAALWYLYG